MLDLELAQYANCFADRRFDARMTRGRRYKRSEDIAGLHFLDPYLLDEGAINESKASARLGGKTQVFTAADLVHVRTRMRHTLEVVSLSVRLAAIMGLNVNLCRAIALGHDLGHAPFGHLGESMISKLSGQPFSHEVFSVVVAQRIERSGHGLNLSFETLEGILCHSSNAHAITVNSDLPYEYAVVKLADKIAYTFADINDILRYGLLVDTPELEAELVEMANWFGPVQRARVLRCVVAMVAESAELGQISFFESETAHKFNALRDWMYATAYLPLVRPFHRALITQAFGELARIYREFDVNPALPLALLTDTEVMGIAHCLLVGDMRVPPYVVNRFGATEILHDLRTAGNLAAANDISNPDLDPADFSVQR